jgi:hypothetical protein
MGHTEFVVSPIDKKRNGTGHPKCLVCVLAEVPAGAPLLKVYAYGPFGARFFLPATTRRDATAESAISTGCNRTTASRTAHATDPARVVRQHQKLLTGCAFA